MWVVHRAKQKVKRSNEHTQRNTDKRNEAHSVSENRIWRIEERKRIRADGNELAVGKEGQGLRVEAGTTDQQVKSVQRGVRLKEVNWLWGNLSAVRTSQALIISVVKSWWKQE